MWFSYGPPAEGALLRFAFVASCFLVAFPPVVKPQPSAAQHFRFMITIFLLSPKSFGAIYLILFFFGHLSLIKLWRYDQHMDIIYCIQSIMIFLILINLIIRSFQIGFIRMFSTCFGKLTISIVL